MPPEAAGAAHFWRHVGTALSGAAAAQAIPVLGSLILARLVVPEEFGLFATWLGVIMVLAVALTGRYEMAIAMERDGASRRTAVAATLVVVACSCAVVALATALAGAAGLAAKLPTALLVMFPVTAGFIAASQALQCWAAAEGRFHDLSIIRVAQATGVIGVQILATLLSPNAAGLAAGQTIGAACGVVIAAWRLGLARGSHRSPDTSATLLDFLRRRRRFPLLALPADAMSTATAQLPLFVVTARFGPEIAGFLALTMRTLGAPTSLLGASVLDVFRRRAASSYEVLGQCRADYIETFKILAIGSALVLVILLPFSEPLFVLAFGERWRLSGVIALWLLPFFALRFVASPLSYVFYVAGKQHVDLLWQIGLLAMTLLTLCLPEGYAGALQFYAAGYCAMYLVYLALSYRFSGGKRR